MVRERLEQPRKVVFCAALALGLGAGGTGAMAARATYRFDKNHTSALI